MQRSVEDAGQHKGCHASASAKALRIPSPVGKPPSPRREVASPSNEARDMPVWGDRYRVLTDASEGAAEVEERARTQINALVDYLETIQEK
jgi:hypothetical protein